MNRTKTMALIALGIFLTACGNDTPTPPNTDVETPPSSITSTDVDTTSPKPAAVVAQDVTWRAVNARMRLTGESVVIMVPEDMDIESGRMLEYREAEDGTLYLKSVIPN
ncbi:MAG: hypothetical protein AAF465_05025 [Pseudomonadota bacterium]